MGSGMDLGGKSKPEQHDVAFGFKIDVLKNFLIDFPGLPQHLSVFLLKVMLTFKYPPKPEQGHGCHRLHGNTQAGERQPDPFQGLSTG